MFNRRLIIPLLLCLLLAPLVAQADVYRYIDRHGRVTFTDKPLHKEYKRIVKTWKGWVERPRLPRNFNWRKNQKKFDPLVQTVARTYRISPALLHAVITTESYYNPTAVSRAGAVGLMQLMPATAKRYGVTDRRDPQQNIRGGSRYLRDLLHDFNHNLELALAAYNAGENAVKKYGDKIPPYAETRNYVKKVMRHYHRYKRTPIG